MGQLKVETPDGQSFVIDYPDGATDEQINSAVRQHLGGKFSGNPIKRNNPIVQGQEALGSKPGYRDLIMQGVSFGLSDEAGGVANMLMHPLTNGAYEQGRDAVRQRVEQARAQTGWAGTAAELGGGLLGGAPKAGAAALLTIGNAAKRGAATVIDLSQTPIIRSLVERQADEGSRLTALESTQALSAAMAAEALRRATEALAIVGGDVPTLSSTLIISTLSIPFVAGASTAFDALQSTADEQDARLDQLEAA